MGVDGGLFERQQQRQPRRWPGNNDRRLQETAGPRRLLVQLSAVPPLRLPRLVHLREPRQRPGLPVGQNVSSLILTSRERCAAAIDAAPVSRHKRLILTQAGFNYV